MLEVKEIYYLNKALDAKKIYGLDPVKNRIFTSEDNEISNSLIKKGILNKDKSLNQLSYLIIRALEYYKKSDKYIRINELIGSLDRTDFMTVLKRKNDDQVEIKRTYKELLIYSIIKNYSFLQLEYKVDNNITRITNEDFLLKILSNKSNKEILSIIVEKDKCEKMIYYYEENNYLYRYDGISEEIRKITSKEARIEIAEMLEFNREEINERRDKN